MSLIILCVVLRVASVRVKYLCWQCPQ